MTTFICPPQELPTEKVRQIVRDAGCDWPEDDSRESRRSSPQALNNCETLLSARENLTTQVKHNDRSKSHRSI